MLGKALHKCGVQSYKIESYLKQVAERKGIKGSFMDNPTWISYVFYEEDDQTYNYVEKVSPGEINLGALSRVVEITNKVLTKELTFAAAKEELTYMKDISYKHWRFVELMAFILSSSSFCIILNTNWVSSIVAGLAGILVFFCYYLASKSDYINSTLESIASFSATIFIGLLSLVYPDINVSLSILSSIIIFIPGLAITTALEEITSYNLISGTAKFAGAMVSLFKQFFGVILGLSILTNFTEIHQAPTIDNIPKWVDVIAIMVLVLSLLPIFRVRLRDYFLCIVIGFISFYSAYLLEFVGILTSIFIGTIIVVLCSKYFARFSKTPRIVFLIPGIVMLVPGSKAFIGLSSVFGDSSVDTPTNMWMQVAFILMGIIGGLLFAGSFRNKKDFIN